MAGVIDSQVPVIADIANFDMRSGSFLERLLFNNRPVVLLLCLVMTVFMGVEAGHVQLNASFNKMIPAHQPFIVNYFEHYNLLQGQGNAVRIAVEANDGTVLNAQYLSTLQKLSDEVYLLPGVDRPYMSSLWTPNTRWTTVTPEGLSGGAVIDQNYDGSKASLAVVGQHIQETGQIGQLVSPDFKSSMIYVPLLEKNNITGKALDYGDLARQLNALRVKYAAEGVTLHITGFAMIVGDLINGINKVLDFFALSVVIAVAMLYWYTRCVRSTLLVVCASLVAVTWQLGFVPLLGFSLNPYSVLVPFLVFAIGMSHGAQKMNGVMQDIGRGTHPLVAARYTFRRLFLAGFAALTCDMLSFAVLLTIRIDAIRELALIASIGVGGLIFTNLIMLPILLSYTGVSKKAALRNMRTDSDDPAVADAHLIWRFLDLFTRPGYAAAAIGVAAGIAGGSWYVGRGLQIGDLSTGAPEFRPQSQYNMDSAYTTSHYVIGSDMFVIMVDTQPYQCASYAVVSKLDDLEWRLQQLPQVLSTSSIASESRLIATMLAEGSPKWYDISSYQRSLNDDSRYVPPNLANESCTFAPIFVALTDHKSKSLNQVVDLVDNFINDPKNSVQGMKITLAGGSAGIEAATNMVIKAANDQMLYLVYASVILFCFITFRSWRAVLCAILPLVFTSLVGQALMVWLHIGIKVATLPVIALGVGIGVDYALYVLSIMLKHMRDGESLSLAYHRTLLFTGRVVLLTGFTLAAGVATWVLAPIQFQADMGLLLSFMFLCNMMGALILVPSLACFLLPPSMFMAQADRVARAGKADNGYTLQRNRPPCPGE
ncbi:efflux RND transporter permease subunit [Acidocella aquatica]|uniref:efflux RND transporter permease subunit n=1 Tax=Acidocella aquatica TaxID=1922313 RepID=UPI0024E0D5C1|nr:MMPL family transporter [Acidocella aquatica]